VYFSNEANYSLTLRMTIASCISGVSADSVNITHISSSDAPIVPFTRRSAHFAASSVASLIVTYAIEVLTQSSQAALQTQLQTASSDGFFNQKLTYFAKQYGAVGFVNATSAALIALSTSPTVSPSAAVAPSRLTSSATGVSRTIEIGLIAAAVLVIAAAVLAAVKYLHGFKHEKDTDIFEELKEDKVESLGYSHRNRGDDEEGLLHRMFPLSALRVFTCCCGNDGEDDGGCSLPGCRRPQRLRSRASSSPLGSPNIGPSFQYRDGKTLVDASIYPRRSSQVEFVNPTFGSMSTKAAEVPHSRRVDSKRQRNSSGSSFQKPHDASTLSSAEHGEGGGIHDV
jgi:hypothetical protein